MLSKSRFNRRLHRIAYLFLTLLRLLGETWKELNAQSIYILVSFPVASYDNYRIYRSKRYQVEIWRGHQASKKRYFYGLKFYVLVTEHGQPVEFFLTLVPIVTRLLIASMILTFPSKLGLLG
jgi:hypothetical protein